MNFCPYRYLARSRLILSLRADSGCDRQAVFRRGSSLGAMRRSEQRRLLISSSFVYSRLVVPGPMTSCTFVHAEFSHGVARFLRSDSECDRQAVCRNVSPPAAKQRSRQRCLTSSLCFVFRTGRYDESAYQISQAFARMSTSDGPRDPCSRRLSLIRLRLLDSENGDSSGLLLSWWCRSRSDTGPCAGYRILQDRG